jgi:putative transposase
VEPSTYYHIYNHANGDENLFREDENYHFFLRQWTKYIEPVAVTYAYCLMPNHFHFLIRTKTSKVFGNLGGLDKQPSRIITQAFSNLFNRRGSLFMPNFKKKPITSDDYLTAIISYIHCNPIHHGFCEGVGDWPHCSYQSLISLKPTRLARKEVLEWFGNIDALNEAHRQNLDIPDKSLLIDF